jgi:hypothetical protein
VLVEAIKSASPDLEAKALSKLSEEMSAKEYNKLVSLLRD